MYDYIVLGGGPAGLQLGYYLEKDGSNYLIIDSSEKVGSFFEKNPRTRTLLSFNKKYSIYSDPEIKLRWDWNSLLTDDYAHTFDSYSDEILPSADDLVRYLGHFQEKYIEKIKLSTHIKRVKRSECGNFCLIDCSGNQYLCKNLIVATGLSQPYEPDIPGINLVSESYQNVNLDPQDFVNQTVLIIGKGNSSFEIADNILSSAALIHLASPESIKMAWNSRFAGHIRANYAKILDTYQLKLLNGNLDCNILNIRKVNGKYAVLVEYLHADGEVEEICYDRVINCTGFQFDYSIFDDSVMPAKSCNPKFPSMSSSWESSNVKNLYFAGTLMQIRDPQRAATAFIDGFRYNIRTLFYFLREKYKNIAIPSDEIQFDEDKLSDFIVHRACRTSALWTQFGYLADLIDLSNGDEGVRYYYEQPIDYILEKKGTSDSNFITLTFEWGETKGDVFSIQRHPKADTAYTNVFLHPILRHYSGGMLLSEHHILEDLFGVYGGSGESGIVLSRGGVSMEKYHKEQHFDPLKKYLKGVFTMSEFPNANAVRSPVSLSI